MQDFTNAMIIRASNEFEAGNLQQARALLNQILEKDGNNFDAIQLLGIIMGQLGKHDVSLGMLSRAVKMKPEDPHALSNLASTLVTMEKFNDATPFLERAIMLKPDLAEAYSNLGLCYKKTDLYNKAFEMYKKAIELKPELVHALQEMPAVAYSLGYYDEMLEYTRRLYEITEVPHLKITMMLASIPHIMRSREEIDRIRSDYEKNLDQLMKEDFLIDNIEDKVIHSSFYLAYHGLNNKTLQIKLARLLEKLCPSLLYEAPGIRNKKHKGKIRLGFFSKYLNTSHPIYIHFGKIISSLAELEDFEVYIITSSQLETDGKNIPEIFSGCKVIAAKDNLRNARKVIGDLGLDILIYTDIGMDQYTYFLAFSRLARVQCAMGGHPDTTGIRNMDYYISSYPCEPENPDNHYSEKLVRVNHLPVYIKKPNLTPVQSGIVAISRSGNHVVYTCPMLLQKLHPDFDSALAEILRRDENGLLILFKGKGDWHNLIEKRMQYKMPPEIFKRIAFVPHAPLEDFMRMLDQSDVILDSFHFGGGTTHFMAFAVGAPVVTLPGEFMRGRVALACYNMMDMTELVAHDMEEYVNIAVKLGKNPEYRKEIKQKILSRNSVLYENPAPISELAEMFRGLSGSI